MTPSYSLTYVINFRDSSNCSRIQNAQPGEETLVLVHPEQEPIAYPLGAKGPRSQDGALFIVEITMADGDLPPVVRPPFKFVHADTLTGAKVRVSGAGGRSSSARRGLGLRAAHRRVPRSATHPATSR